LPVTPESVLAHLRIGCEENSIGQLAGIREEHGNPAANILGFIVKAGPIKVEHILAFDHQRGHQRAASRRDFGFHITAPNADFFEAHQTSYFFTTEAQRRSGDFVIG
jgi:hypothetical protein